MNIPLPDHALLMAIAARFAQLTPVTAVVLAGSRTATAADARSDYDLYIYAPVAIDLDTRRAIALTFATHFELDQRFWEPGDAWRTLAPATLVDLMYRSPAWIEAQLARVLEQHEPSIGYSTCFWYNVRHSHILFDREGWFAELQARAHCPYPEPLRRAIVAKNWPILRDIQSSYVYQLTSAVARNDRVSLNHRLTALLASYFDLLFALNRLPHPGEKRLAAFAAQHCPLQPPAMLAQLEAVLTATDTAVLPAIHALLDGLESLLRAEALL